MPGGSGDFPGGNTRHGRGHLPNEGRDATSAGGTGLSLPAAASPQRPPRRREGVGRGDRSPAAKAGRGGPSRACPASSAPRRGVGVSWSFLTPPASPWRGEHDRHRTVPGTPSPPPPHRGHSEPSPPGRAAPHGNPLTAAGPSARMREPRRPLGNVVESRRAWGRLHFLPALRGLRMRILRPAPTPSPPPPPPRARYRPLCGGRYPGQRCHGGAGEDWPRQRRGGTPGKR